MFEKLVEKVKDFVAEKVIVDVDRWAKAGPEGVVFTCPACKHETSVSFEELHASSTCPCGQPFVVSDFPVDADSSDAVDAVLASVEGPVVVDFWAAWCGPCLTGMPQVIESASVSAGRYLVVRSNVESATRAAEDHDIMGMPTMLRFVGGKETHHLMGSHQAGEIVSFALGENDEAVTT